MQDFRRLDVWHKAHALTLAIYRRTEQFPRTETFGLVTTLRRGATQITTRIAEACGQTANAEFLRSLQISRGITLEIEYQLLLAHDLQFLTTDVYDGLQDQVVEVRRMLSGVMKARSLPSFDTLAGGPLQGETHGNGSVGAGRD